MAQKFVPLEDAANQLGISKERLNELREGGKVRAYRDGTSWKFRAEDLSALSQELESLKGPSASDLALESLDEPSDPADSILVSDAEVGESPDRPPSTVIGEKKGKSAAESDLELSLSDSGGAGDSKAAAGASDVLASGSGSNVLGPSETPPVPSGKFEDLDEIDIDLETESSQVHSDVDVPKSKQGDQEEESDLQLVDSGVQKEGGPGSSGSEIRLAEDEADDMVLSESSGSDVSLSPGDSGINLVSPSDSGLALDDLDLDLAGSSASSLELDEEQVAAQEGEAAGKSKKGGPDEDFLLTPLGETGEGDSSSQVIELDSEEELHESTEVITDRPVEETAILEPVEEEEMEAGPMPAPVGAGAPVAPAQAVEFTGANIAFLIICLLVLGICGIMMLDLLRQIWSWDQPFAINSTLMEALNFFD